MFLRFNRPSGLCSAFLNSSNLQVNFQPNWFAPFGELRDEYLPYVGRVVEAGPDTSHEEIGAQIKEGKVFVVVKCNINY